MGYALLADGDAAAISVTNVSNKSDDETGDVEQASLARILGDRQGTLDYQDFQDSQNQSADISRVN